MCRTLRQDFLATNRPGPAEPRARCLLLGMSPFVLNAPPHETTCVGRVACGAAPGVAASMSIRRSFFQTIGRIPAGVAEPLARDE